MEDSIILNPQWQPTPANPSTTEAEWAWAAGLFEGEGCIHMSLPRRIFLLINLTDLDVLQKFQRIVGIGTITEVKPHRNSKPHYKPLFLWRATSYPDLLLIAEKFSPWLGKRRAAKLKEAVAAVPRHPNSPRKQACKRGHPLSGDNADVRVTTKRGLQRQCRVCDRAARKQTFSTRTAKADKELGMAV